MSWKLFLDDIRNPPSDDFVVARSSEEAIRLIQENGVPQFISFDHDLGGDDSAMRVCKFLSENFYEAEIAYFIHSANPVGRDNIDSYMKSWKKSKEI